MVVDYATTHPKSPSWKKGTRDGVLHFGSVKVADASDGFYRSIGQIPSPMKNYTEEQKSNPSPPKSNEGVGDG